MHCYNFFLKLPKWASFIFNVSFFLSSPSSLNDLELELVTQAGLPECWYHKHGPPHVIYDTITLYGQNLDFPTTIFLPAFSSCSVGLPSRINFLPGEYHLEIPLVRVSLVEDYTLSGFDDLKVALFSFCSKNPLGVSTQLQTDS